MTDQCHRPLSADVAERFSRTAQEPVTAPYRPAAYVLDSLRCLGNDADTVAQTLKDLGITGTRGSSRSCPIATYIDGLGKGFVYAIATGSRAYVYTEDHPYVLVIEHPIPVADFIEEFDEGLYEYLETPYEYLEAPDVD